MLILGMCACTLFCIVVKNLRPLVARQLNLIRQPLCRHHEQCTFPAPVIPPPPLKGEPSLRQKSIGNTRRQRVEGLYWNCYSFSATIV